MTQAYDSSIWLARKESDSAVDMMSDAWGKALNDLGTVTDLLGVQSSVWGVIDKESDALLASYDQMKAEWQIVGVEVTKHSRLDVSHVRLD